LDGGHADPDLAPERGRVGLLEDRVAVVEAADNTATVAQLQTDIDAAEVLIGQVSNTANSKQPTLLRPLFPATGVELINDSSQVKRLLGSGGVEIAVAQHQEGSFTYDYANVALDSTHQGLPTRVDTLETDVATRTTQHNNLQGEVTNGQGAQNTRLDVLERRFCAKIGPLTTGSSNSASTSYGGNYITTQTIAFPSGLFTAAPIVLCNQGASSNNTGHSSIQRVWVSSCSVNSCDIIISDSAASLNVYIDILVVQP